jgi:hypothetical protein
MQNTMLGMRGEPMEGCSRTPRRAKYCLKGVSIRYSVFRIQDSFGADI